MKRLAALALLFSAPTVALPLSIRVDSETATFYGMHTKRGREAIDDFDILPKFDGIAVHQQL